jgi:DNA gyrase subunit B
MPCASQDPEVSELFIVEGDSAGGTAKSCRNPRIQAILPLRGKVLNSLRASWSKILANTELKSLFSALNVDVQTERRTVKVEYSNLRYHKVIICTDADPDGGHITCLLLTFFYMHLRKLIENGYMYVAELPLFQVAIKNEIYFIRDDTALIEFKAKHKNIKMDISRLKGLGEMDAPDLGKAAFDPKTRNLRQITIEDAKEANDMFVILMGEDASLRKNFIDRNVDFGTESE